MMRFSPNNETLIKYYYSYCFFENMNRSKSILVTFCPYRRTVMQVWWKESSINSLPV